MTTKLRDLTYARELIDTGTTLVDELEAQNVGYWSVVQALVLELKAVADAQEDYETYIYDHR